MRDDNANTLRLMAVAFLTLLGVFFSASLSVAADDAGQTAFLKEKCDR